MTNDELLELVGRERFDMIMVLMYLAAHEPQKYLRAREFFWRLLAYAPVQRKAENEAMHSSSGIPG